VASKRKILCVEDERETAALLAEDLAERGYEVHVAHDGKAGFAAILTLEPDLVISDVSMPVLSGFALLERVTAYAPRFKDMPFVFLTALRDRDTELKGRRLGADDYVAKPIDFELLATIIEARLARVARSRTGGSSAQLSERELETLTWAARGKTSEEIASILGLSKRTVDFHIDNARGKLSVATRTQAVLRAVSTGLITP